MEASLGARWDGQAVHFAVFSKNATAVDLCLFERPESVGASRKLALEQKGDGIWRRTVPGLGPGTLYGYRVHGPYAPAEGHRFNPGKLLVDPYARAITGEPRFAPSLFALRRDENGRTMYDGTDSAGAMPKCVVVDERFDWGDDRPPNIPWRDTVIYETHVKGLTRLHPDVPEALRGTYLGLASPPVLEHLVDLGITAVELLPVHQIARETHLGHSGLPNYWGYSTLGFFAPNASYATGSLGEQVAEFKTMVRAFHRAGLEVFLDVVFNHTAEGDQWGPTLSLRGFDNREYYFLRQSSRGNYQDATGCGNTVDCNRPAGMRLVLDSLRYWVGEMRVDGFRFDLATVLGRTGRGEFTADAPLFRAMLEDPVISRAKLIAEPWDLGQGGYRLGGFPAPFGEWNDRYRDTLRRFWRGDPGLLAEVATRLSGSSDVFGHGSRSHCGKGERGPQASINYVISHDGFTLADLVSYERKHNLANGEDNRDGTDNNSSRNWGVEGPTDHPAILTTRRRIRRNLYASLLLSLGVPLVHQGDEISHSQGGNNNPYCQDNPTAWIDWSPQGYDQSFLHFARRVVSLRRRFELLRRERYPEPRELLWWHPEGREMGTTDWGNAHGRTLGLGFAEAPGEAPALFLWLNASGNGVQCRLPPGSFQVELDTSLDVETEPAEVEGELWLEPLVVVLLRRIGSLGSAG